MVRAELMGAHTHSTRTGTRVHIWLRDGKYLARGSYEGRRFGETLGEGDAATSRLRELLVEIDNKAFVPPSEARKRTVKKSQSRRLSIREVITEFIHETRRLRGRKTAGTYQSRLLPILDFAELPKHRKRWPFAANVDREFVIELRAFLYQYMVTRNGRAGAKPKPMSGRTIINVMECFRTLLHWAKRADVRQLPPDWANPLTQDLIGAPPPKDPLREDLLPLDSRIKIVGAMDRWQLCHLSLSLTVPLRPEEAAGLMVSDIDIEKKWLTIGTRLGGSDFTKARQSYKLPFAPEFLPLFRACIGGRQEGPLLRNRKAFQEPATSKVGSFDELTGLYEQELRMSPGDHVQTEQDRKRVFRGLLRKLGGISEDRMAFEFKRLAKCVGIAKGVTLYHLRHATTKGLKDAGLAHLDLLYLTAHSTSSILNEYTPVDPVGAMEKYFATIRPLLNAITQRAHELGLMGV